MPALTEDEFLLPDSDIRFPSFELMGLDERLKQLQIDVARFLQSHIPGDQNVEVVIVKVIGLSKEIHKIEPLLNEWIQFFSTGELVEWGSQLASNCDELLSILATCKFGKRFSKASQPRLLELLHFLDIASQQAMWALGYWLSWKEKEGKRRLSNSTLTPTLEGLISSCENELDYVREHGQAPYWAPRKVHELWHDALQLEHPIFDLPELADESVNDAFLRGLKMEKNKAVWTSAQINQYVSFLTAMRQWGLSQKPGAVSQKVTDHSTQGKSDKIKTKTQPIDDGSHGFIPSDDFRSAKFKGERFSFSTNQARCIQVLFEHWKKGTAELAAQTILEEVESSNNRLDQIFRKTKDGKTVQHPAWGTLIVKGNSKGTFRLNLPDPPD